MEIGKTYKNKYGYLFEPGYMFESGAYAGVARLIGGKSIDVVVPRDEIYLWNITKKKTKVWHCIYKFQGRHYTSSLCDSRSGFYESYGSNYPEIIQEFETEIESEVEDGNL